MTPAQPPRTIGLTARDRVAAQLESLVSAFGLDNQSARIRTSFAMLGERALNFPLGEKPRTPSRLNADGTSIQFATTIGAARPSLRFVADPGPLDGDPLERVAFGHRTVRALAELIRADLQLARAEALMARLAPEDSTALRADPAGAFWIGAAFTPDRCAGPARLCQRRVGHHRDATPASRGIRRLLPP